MAVSSTPSIQPGQAKSWQQLGLPLVAPEKPASGLALGPTGPTSKLVTYLCWKLRKHWLKGSDFGSEQSLSSGDGVWMS